MDLYVDFENLRFGWREHRSTSATALVSELKASIESAGHGVGEIHLFFPKWALPHHQALELSRSGYRVHNSFRADKNMADMALALDLGERVRSQAAPPICIVSEDRDLALAAAHHRSHGRDIWLASHGSKAAGEFDHHAATHFISVGGGANPPNSQIGAWDTAAWRLLSIAGATLLPALRLFYKGDRGDKDLKSTRKRIERWNDLGKDDWSTILDVDAALRVLRGLPNGITDIDDVADRLTDAPAGTLSDTARNQSRALTAALVSTRFVVTDTAQSWGVDLRFTRGVLLDIRRLALRRPNGTDLSPNDRRRFYAGVTKRNEVRGDHRLYQALVSDRSRCGANAMRILGASGRAAGATQFRAEQLRDAGPAVFSQDFEASAALTAGLRQTAPRLTGLSKNESRRVLAETEGIAERDLHIRVS
ncbi:MAG: NYN domain-containing protein [bacterium]|nr:NYN domain-containing protein [bacterium]